MLRLKSSKRRLDFPTELSNANGHALEDSVVTASPPATGDGAGQAVPPSPASPASPPASIALVEREKEFDRLKRYWQAAEEGHGKVVLLSGEAGHGKSSLAEAFLKYVSDDPKLHKIARAACSAQSGRDEPFWPFADVISQLAAHTGTKKVAGDILDAVLELAPSWTSVIPVAGGVVGASIKTAQIMRTHIKTSEIPSPDKLLHEYVGALKKVAAKQPVLIFVDDVHWSDSASIKLLSHLSRNIADVPVLIVVAYRPSDIAVEGHPLHDLIDELLRYDTETVVNVPPLTGAGVNALIKRLYPSNKFPDTLASALFSSTGGSPFFVVESLHLMQSREQIVRDPKDGKWMLVRDLNDDDLPTSVEAVIRKRLERMPKDLQEALAQAAVQGVDFESAVLAHVLDKDELAVMKLIEPAEKVHDVITYVGDVELVEDITSRYRFCSSLIQRELLDTLRGKQLMIAHRRTAEGLEGLWGSDSDDLAAKLATHYEKGKVWEKAGYYNIAAGKQARAAGAIPQAIALFENAERLLTKAGAVPSEQQFEIDENLSYLFELDGSYDKSEARAWRALVPGFGALGWRKYAALQMRIAKLADSEGRLSESLALLEQVLAMLHSAKPEDVNSPEAFELHAEYSLALTHVDRAAEGARHAEAALEQLGQLPENDERLRLRIRLMTSQAEAHAAEGNYGQVADLLDQICHSAENLHAIDTLAEALVNRAQLDLVLGQYEHAAEDIKTIFDTAEQIGSETLRASAYLVTARSLVYQSKPLAAMHQLEEAERLVSATKFYAARPELYSLRAIALINLGRTNDALPILDRAKAVADSSGSREWVAYVDMFQALRWLAQGDASKALDLAKAANQVFTQEGARFEQAWSWRVMGRAFRSLSETDQSKQAFEAARGIYAAIGNQPQVAATLEEESK